MNEKREFDENDKRITFVVPMKNAEQTIEACLRSICAQAQTVNNEIKIVIVNDNSQDDSAKRVAQFKSRNKTTDVQLIRNEYTMGRAATRNIGLSRVQTPYVAFVDSDVELPSKWLESCIKKFQDNRIACVSTSVQPDGYLSHFSELFDVQVIPKRPTNNIHGSNMLCKTAIIRELGGFNVNLPDGEDTDLGYRILHKKLKICFIEDLICKHYVRPSIKSLMKRSFSHGRAGTLLFIRYRKLKSQDVAFLVFLAFIFVAVIFGTLLDPGSIIWFLLCGVFMLLTGSAVFTILNFNFRKKKNVLPALIVASLFIFIYLLGRLRGILSVVWRVNKHTKL
ncbi:glycosyltransferase [Candidatus Bathyarchaeota archaeon]|nr:glycosyltransferase [Candidatus Bathyarchaeota archaeon]